MDQFYVSIKIEDRAEGKPRLIGTLMEYGTEVRDRREAFEPGSLSLGTLEESFSIDSMSAKIPS